MVTSAVKAKRSSLSSNERASTVIQFAFAFTVFICIILGICDIASILLQKSQLRYALAEAQAAAQAIPWLDVTLDADHSEEAKPICQAEAAEDCKSDPNPASCEESKINTCVSKLSKEIQGFDCAMFAEAIYRIESVIRERILKNGLVISDISLESPTVSHLVPINYNNNNVSSCLLTATGRKDFRVGIVRPGEEVTAKYTKGSELIAHPKLSPEQVGNPPERMENLAKRTDFQLVIGAEYHWLSPLMRALPKSIAYWPIADSRNLLRQEVPRGRFGEIHNAKGELVQAPEDPRKQWQEPEDKAAQGETKDVGERGCSDAKWSLCMGLGKCPNSKDSCSCTIPCNGSGIN